jgi:UDP-galactopyranose mutase
MSSLAEYFEANRPKPRYQFGDRVEGVYQGIPYVGTVYTDNMRNLLEGPMVSIHLDLPMKIGKTWHDHIRVKYKEIKGLRR